MKRKSEQIILDFSTFCSNLMDDLQKSDCYSLNSEWKQMLTSPNHLKWLLGTCPLTSGCILVLVGPFSHIFPAAACSPFLTGSNWRIWLFYCSIVHILKSYTFKSEFCTVVRCLVKVFKRQCWTFLAALAALPYPLWVSDGHFRIWTQWATSETWDPGVLNPALMSIQHTRIIVAKITT